MGERREKREQDDSEKKAPLSITAVPMEQSALKTVALFPVPCSFRLRLPSPVFFLPLLFPDFEGCPRPLLAAVEGGDRDLEPVLAPRDLLQPDAPVHPGARY